MAKVALTVQRIESWPRELTRGRTGGQFQAGWDSTVGILRREIAKMQTVGGDVLAVLGLAVGENDIRVDGTNLKADARFAHPGVLIAFPSRHGPLKFYCDHFVGWRHNVRGVALTLERLRMADLYGVTRRGEQYTGWRALPPAIVTPPAMTVGEAAAFMARDVSGCTPADVAAHPDNARRAYRAQAARYHPDTNAGNQRPEWLTLQAAKQALDLHHGLK